MLNVNISDGDEVHIDTITNTKDFSKWRIRCICFGGIVKCEKIVNTCMQNIEGCPFLEESTHTNKSKGKIMMIFLTPFSMLKIK